MKKSQNSLLVLALIAFLILVGCSNGAAAYYFKLQGKELIYA